MKEPAIKANGGTSGDGDADGEGEEGSRTRVVMVKTLY